MLFVFLMQTGFAMLEVGSVDVKNTRNILLKVGIIMFEKQTHELLFIDPSCPYLF